MRAGLIGAVLALGGAGGFATYSALSSPAGPSSPEEAVDAFIAAVDAEDLVGVAELIAPSERETLAEPALETYAHLQRLGVIDDAGMTAETGFDIEVDGATYSVIGLNDEVSWISFTGGTITSSTTDNAGLGPVVMDQADRDAVTPTTSTESLTDLPSFAVIEQDGGWYVSFTYTAAEHARREAGLGLPDFDASPVPDGADSPEGALTEFVDEMVEVDLEGMLTHLDPVEFAAAYDYLPLVLDGAQADVDAMLDELRAGGVEWDVEVTDVRVVEQNGRTLAIVEGVTISFHLDASMSGDVVLEGDCMTATITSFGETETTTECSDSSDLETSMAAAGFDATELPSFIEKLEGLESGVTVVERDGRWFVSIVPTAFGTFNDVLDRLDRTDIDEGIGWLGDLMDRGVANTLTEAMDLGEGDLAGDQFVEIEDSIVGDFDFDVDPDGGPTTTMPAQEVDIAALIGVDVPSAEDAWDYDPTTWWATSVFGAPPADAYATLWVGFSWVDIVVLPTADDAALTAAVIQDTQPQLLPSTLDGVPADAVVLASDDEVIVIADRYVFVTMPDTTDALLAVVADVLG